MTLPVMAYRHLAGLLLIVLAAGILSMPLQEYPADPRVVRCETVSMIEKGTLAIPPDIATKSGERGQYFVENDARHQWYCKYGILNSVIYIPVLLLEKGWTGQLPYFSPNRLIFLNLFNIALSLVTAAYLYFIIARYTKSAVISYLFILSAFYSTCWWNYLRAQNSEIYQVLFMLGFYYHITSLFRPSPSKDNRRANLLLAGSFVGLLILGKSVYVILIPFALLSVLLYEKKRPSFSSDTLRSAAIIAIPLAIAVALVLLVDTYKFGSPFETGYGQWQERGRPLFSGNIGAGLYGFLFDFRYSIFLYFPLLIPALFGYRAFISRYPLDSLLILSMSLAVLLLHSQLFEWRAGWAYGPRYMLVVLPLLSLPFILVLESLLVPIRTWWAMSSFTLLILMFSYSFHQQMQVNALPFITYYLLRDDFHRYNIPGLDAYFDIHDASAVNEDLMAYKKGQPWEPLEIVGPRLTPVQLGTLLVAIRKTTFSNYYWWPDTNPAQK